MQYLNPKFEYLFSNALYINPMKSALLVSLTSFYEYDCCQVAIDGVALDKAKKSTAVIHNSKDPSWENDQFEFQIRGNKIKQKPMKDLST